MRRFLIAAVLVVAAAAAGIAVNLALLGFARPNNDPVGRLSPRALTVPARSSPRPAITPGTTSTPATTGRDDD